MSQNLQNFVKFQKFQLDNLVDFEKCCKTHIYLQKSVPIQPKTSNILPKFCQKLATTLRVRRRRLHLSQTPSDLYLANRSFLLQLPWSCSFQSPRQKKEARHHSKNEFECKTQMYWGVFVGFPQTPRPKRVLSQQLLLSGSQ